MFICTDSLKAIFGNGINVPFTGAGDEILHLLRPGEHLQMRMIFEMIALLKRLHCTHTTPFRLACRRSPPAVSLLFLGSCSSGSPSVAAKVPSPARRYGMHHPRS